MASGEEEEAAGQETTFADHDYEVDKLVRSLQLGRSDHGEGATHTRPAGEDGDKDNSPLLFGFRPSSAPIGLCEEKERPLSSVAADAVAAVWDEEQKRGGKVEVGAKVDMWREEEEWEGK